ncbi:MAG: hypothetical protein IV107_25185 [Paucibacter sp.]|nr:hypothetical protein [Roseateles sp.]
MFKLPFQLPRRLPLPKKWQLFCGLEQAWLQSPAGEVSCFNTEAKASALQQCFDALRLEPRPWPRLQPRLQVLVSGALAQPFVCGPAPGLQHWKEATELAQAMASSATQLPEGCISSIEHWPEHVAVLATALNERFFSELTELAQGAGVSLTSVRPWWAMAMSALKSNRASGTTADADLAQSVVAFSDPDSLTILIGHGQVPTLALSNIPRPNPQQQSDLLHRLLVSESLEEGSLSRFEVLPGQGADASLPWIHAIAANQNLQESTST